MTDSHVAPLYLERVRASLEEAGFRVTAHTVPAGESSKCAARLAELWEAMMDAGLTRTDAVAALGGGVVGGSGGVRRRHHPAGVDFVQIPTTLLAQVDSSVGGKVAVDLEYGKNLAGAFWQPRLVLMDPEVLDTLPLPVFMEGMAEVVKYGCIRDAAFFDFLAAQPSRAELMAEMEHILYTCCAIKRSVVEQDERDTGERMLLNFGHTLGHAYELAGHYTEWSHGAAVAAGMRRRPAGCTPGGDPGGAAGAPGGGALRPGAAHRHPLHGGGLRRRRGTGQEGGGGGHFGDPPGAHGPRRPPPDAQGQTAGGTAMNVTITPRRPGRRRHPAALQVPGPPADHRRRPVRRGVPPVQCGAVPGHPGHPAMYAHPGRGRLRRRHGNPRGRPGGRL